MYLNREIFHSFYYGGDRGRSNSNTSFVKNHFFSYSTEIGCVVNVTKPVTLIADSGFTPTTAGHRSALLHASPNDLIFVDFDWDDDFTSKTDLQVIQIMRKRQVYRLRLRLKALHRQEKERVYTQGLLDNFEALLDAGGLKPNQYEQQLLDKLHAAIEDTEENQLKWKAERAKVAKLTRTKAERERKAKVRHERKVNQTRVLVKQWLEECHPGFGELLEALFQNQYTADSGKFGFIVKLSHGEPSALNSELGKELHRLADLGDRYLSYVWPDPQNPEQVVTSQGMRMDVDTVRTAYRAWKHGKLAEGMHIGPYVIRRLDDKCVQIGCHLIPMLNITYLAEKLQLEA